MMFKLKTNPWERDPDPLAISDPVYVYECNITEYAYAHLEIIMDTYMHNSAKYSKDTWVCEFYNTSYTYQLHVQVQKVTAWLDVRKPVLSSLVYFVA